MTPPAESPKSFDDVLATIDTWGAEHAAAAVLGPGGVIARRGDAERSFRWASVTKLVTAWAVLIATERGSIDLDEPAGPPGSTVRHLLAHASGWTFDGVATLATPGTRRIYSNTGYDRLGRLLEERSGQPVEAVLRTSVLGPLGMASTRLLERPSQGLHGSLDDLCRFAGELLRPTLLSPATAALATSVAFPGIKGVIPGIGNFDPCDWGLGPELRDGKAPHWTGGTNSPATLGHFGGSGTGLWVDPVSDLALVILTDREFGPWAMAAWPRFADAVLAAAAAAADADPSG
jgi:CubicO group peptidase (beta-lactamase class C family)